MYYNPIYCAFGWTYLIYFGCCVNIKLYLNKLDILESLHSQEISSLKIACEYNNKSITLGKNPIWQVEMILCMVKKKERKR